MNYDPLKYWNSRGNPNALDSPTSLERGFLSSLIAFHKSILDVGPGVGRMFELYSPEHHLQGLDFTGQYEDKALSRAAALGLNYGHRVMNYYRSGLPYCDKQFGLCVSTKVLLHVTPAQLGFLMKEMARVSDTVAVTTKVGEDPASHVYNHDYQHWAKRLNLDIMYREQTGNQLHFIYADLN